jgi:hypothetical protein
LGDELKKWIFKNGIESSNLAALHDPHALGAFRSSSEPISMPGLH